MGFSSPSLLLAAYWLLPHAVAGLAWCFWLLPREVLLNTAMIKADGSADTLHQGFHQRRGWVRFWQWLACVAVGSLPALHYGALPFAISFGGLGGFLGGFFAAAFTPALNVARGLPKYYVSFAPNAARWPDQELAAKARARWPDGDEAQQRASAALGLQRLTGKLIAGTALCYALGLLAYLGLAGVGVWGLQPHP